MHLAFLTPEYPHPASEKFAGLGTSIKNLAVGLVSRGVKVSIFVYGQKEDLQFHEGQINLYFIGQRKYSFLGWYRYRKFLENYINKIIEEKSIDALEAADWTGITAFMKFDCQLVIRLHGSDTYFCRLENRKQRWKNFFFEKTALKNADRIISVSNFAASKTTQYFSLKQEIRTIPNFIDTRIFKPSKTGQETSNQILYLGSLIRKKGIFDLALIFNQVVKSIPNIRLDLVGQDVKDIQTGRSSFQLFKDLLSPEARNRIDYHGRLPYEQVKDQIEKASILVFPSYAEALPMTWLEAMAMEKALVTSNIGWAYEIMQEGKTGFMVPPNDHQTYASRISEIIQNSKMRKSMEKQARKRILSKFSADKVIQMNIDFYKNVIGK